MPQDVYLVDDTLRANVALGWRGDDIDDEAVDEAIRLASSTMSSASFRPGSRQSLASGECGFPAVSASGSGWPGRSYVRPTVLILDEATSNLDSATEQRIVATLGELRSGLTTIVVTHRMSTVRDCDRIIYLEQGIVRASGSFEELTAFMVESGSPGWPERLTVAAG